MRRLEIAASAKRDVARILDESLDRHGRRAAVRYKQLIDLGFRELRENPLQPASKASPATGLRLYALRFPARRLDATVRSPSHVIVYGFNGTTVEIVRLLHEAMDLPARLGPQSD